MPKLACRACGRQVYTASAFEALFAEERRCPRCGAILDTERRGDGDRRKAQRRVNPRHDPGPPAGTAERRVADRRRHGRREAEGGGWAGS